MKTYFVGGAWFNYAGRRWPCLQTANDAYGYIPYDALYEHEIAEFQSMGLPHGGRGILLQGDVVKSITLREPKPGDEVYAQWFLSATDPLNLGYHEAYFKWFRRFVLVYRGTPSLGLEETLKEWVINCRWLLGSEEHELIIHRFPLMDDALGKQMGMIDDEGDE